MKPTYHIAVTGLNAIDSPGPGLSVIRALRDAKAFDVRIIGFAYENLEPCIYMHDYLDKTYIVPPPTKGQDALLERICYIHQMERLDMIIPNFDAELYNYIVLQEQLENRFNIKMFLPSKAQFEARHKVNLSEYGKKYGILVPQSIEVLNTKEAIKAADELGYPVVVKGKFYDAKIAYNADQVQQFFYKITQDWGLPILIQKFLEGKELNVCGVADGKGTMIGAVPMKKLYITDKGKAWSGVTIEDEELLAITKHWIAETHWKGGFELELIKTEKSEYYLIEINPRFPAWCYLPVGAGQNQLEAMVLMAMGEDVEPFEHYDLGKMFVRYSYDLIVDMQDYSEISIKGELERVRE